MKIFFVSLGCDKNRVDSEKVLKYLFKKTSFEIVDEPRSSDIAIINTCCFIYDAKKESIEWIDYLIKLKKNGIIKRIMVLGCLATEIIKFNIDNYENYKKYIDIILPLENYVGCLNSLSDRFLDILSFSSSIKISDGCNKFCSYCIIPYLRGRYVSNSIDNIIEEVNFLADNGVKELNIVGQDILNYGIDIYGEKKIVNLIEEITKNEKIEWVRLLYCYPEEIDDELISLIKTNKKVLHYIDMPIQHISDKILRLMNRNTTKKSIIDLINKLRLEIPDIIIRTTLMVGFPYENDDDFNELVEFVKEMKIDKLGVFAYSREKKAKAYNFTNQIDEKTKMKRKKIILDIQKNLVNDINKKHLGNTYYSIVEGYDYNKNKYIVRPYFNARDIDDNVYVESDTELISGAFINVKINKIINYDLEGEIV